MPWQNPYRTEEEEQAQLQNEWNEAGDEQAALQKEWNEVTPQPTTITAPQSEMQREIDKMPTAEKGLVGIGAGYYNAYKGAQQAGAQLVNKFFPGIVDKATVDRITAEGTEARNQFEQLRSQSTAANLGDIVGQSAPFIPIGGVGLKSAIGVGAASGLLQFNPEGSEDSRLGNAGKGTLGGAVGLGLGKLAGTTFTKGFNFLRGKFGDPAAKGVEATAKKYGIPTAYQDATRNPVATSMGTTLEKLPGGLGDFRADQHNKAFGTTADFLNSFFKPGFEDWAAAAKTGLETGARNAKRVAAKLYDRVEQLAGVRNVPLPTTISTIDRLLAEEEAKIMPNASITRMLEKARNQLTPSVNMGGSNNLNLTPALQAQLKAKLAASGINTPIAGITDTTFTDMRKFMSGVNSLIREAKSGKNALVGQRDLPTLMQLKEAVAKDMDDFASQQGGELKAAYQKANKYYQDKVVPYRTNKILPQIERETDPDKVYRLFVNATKDVGSPQVLYKALSPRGRRAVEYGMIKDAFDTAVNAEGSRFSPAKFARQMEIRQDATGIFFSKQTRAEVEGFRNLMRHIERAGQYMENPPTGMRNLWNAILGTSGFGAGAAHFLGHPGVAGALAAGAATEYGMAKGLSWLFTSNVGKRFLLAASKTKPGGAMEFLMQRMLPRAGAKVAIGNEAAPEFIKGQIEKAVLPPPTPAPTQPLPTETNYLRSGQ